MRDLAQQQQVLLDAVERQPQVDLVRCRVREEPEQVLDLVRLKHRLGIELAFELRDAAGRNASLLMGKEVVAQVHVLRHCERLTALQKPHDPRAAQEVENSQNVALQDKFHRRILDTL